MKKYLCSISLFFCVCFTTAQPLGNFNGLYNSSGYNGHYEKLLQTSVFPNNVPDLAVDVLLGNYAFWGSIEVEITGDYLYQNTSGKLSKIFAVGINPGGYIYTNESRVTDAIGHIVDNISIGELKWDAVNGRYCIPVSHTVTTMNYFTIKVKLFSQGIGATSIGSQLAVSDQYSMPALPRNAVNYNWDMGIGTTVPKNLLHLHGSADGYGYLRISDPVTGNQSTDGARIGYNSGAFRIQNYENSKMSFHINGNTEALTINNDGNIGIGVVTPSEKLSINGNVRAKKIIISQTGWPDYVFEPAYKLKTLSELAAFIQQYKHLPDMPSAKEVEEKGISVGDNQALLLKKVEELTLYIIDLQKQIEELKNKKQDK